MNRPSIALILATTAVAATALTGTSAAYAGGGGGGNVVYRALDRPCGGGDISLKAKLDNRMIEVEAEVDTNVIGQTWAVTIRRGTATTSATTVFVGNGTTAGLSGSFSVERLISNLAGDDNISVTATRGLVTCTTSLIFKG